jgi:hypothetical protein
VADDRAAAIAGEAATDLLGRPAIGHAAQDLLAQRIVALEPRSRPAAGGGLLLGVGRAIADLEPLLRFSSLEMADGWRSRAAAICRIDCPPSEGGQSHTVPRSKVGGRSTWQHLSEVLHFVCELRGIHELGHRRAGFIALGSQAVVHGFRLSSE